MTLSSKSDAELDMQAAEWLTRLLDTAPDPSDPNPDRPALQAEFYTWVTLSRRHLEIFLETVETFKKLDGIDPHHQIDVRQLLGELPSSVVQLRNSKTRELVQDRLGSAESRHQNPGGRQSIRARWPWAAVFAAVLIVPMIVPLPPQRTSAAPTYYATSLGERRKIVLPDRSSVYLNTNSRIEVGDLSRPVREVQLLAGEALFEVAHNSFRPFRVRIPGALVQDIGTKFSVYLHEGETTVSVVEGEVQVFGGEKMSTRLVAGNAADLSPSGVTHTPIRHVPLQDLKRKLSWTEGTLTFTGETLAEVAAEFNRYNVRQIVVDPAIRDLRVGGIFFTTDPEGFVAAITAAGTVKVLPPDNRISSSEEIRLGLHTGN